MPTGNYNLPLIADNMANDVVRDMNALAEAADGAIKAVSDGKVDKVSGKQLSTNDYTTTEKNKLAGIATSANNTTVNNTLTSTSTTAALSAAQGKALKDLVDTKASSTNLTTLDNKVTQHLDGTNHIGLNHQVGLTGWVQQSIPSGVQTKVIFNGQDFGNNAYFEDNKLKIAQSGRYLVIANVAFTNASSGLGTISLARNGIFFDSVFDRRPIPTIQGQDGTCAISAVVQLYINDYVEMYAHQTSGTALNMTQRHFEIVRVG